MNITGKHRNRGQGEAGYGDDFKGIIKQIRALRKPDNIIRRGHRTPLMEAMLRMRGII